MSFWLNRKLLLAELLVSSVVEVELVTIRVSLTNMEIIREPNVYFDN